MPALRSPMAAVDQLPAGTRWAVRTAAARLVPPGPRRAEDQYKALAGLDPSPYLGRWLLVTGVLFAGSALAYAVRLRRDKSPRRPRARAEQRPDG